MTTEPLNPDAALSLAFAVVASSTAPLILLDGEMVVQAASASFCRAFGLQATGVVGKPVFDLGKGEWNSLKLRSLLGATLNTNANIEAYEMDLRQGSEQAPRRLVLNAHKLDYDDLGHVRILLSVADVTDARIAERLKDDLIREKSVLLQEVQHRVANSLQIIASIILQSARRVQSPETQLHLADAHSRVMSVAQLQRQLASSGVGEVDLKAYLQDLCASVGASMIRDHTQIALEVQADEAVKSADASVSFGLVVTELVINSLKHAFPDFRIGKIVVGYHADGGDWTLSVTDNGVGIKAADPTAKAGLGTSIVNALAAQLGATVEISDTNPGTAVSLVHRAAAPTEPVAVA